MNIGQTVYLNNDTGQIVKMWPDGTWVLVQWQPGKSEIAGRVLWAPTWMVQIEREGV